MKFEPEFKEAIRRLTPEEKDKLILRLLKRDIPLANRLYFELVSTDSAEDRRSELEQRVRKSIEKMGGTFYSWGYLLMDLRYLSGDITEHVKITKDKIGEVSLQLVLLNEWLEKFVPKINGDAPGNSQKICVYIVAKVYKVLLLIQALHEDYRVEFREDLNRLGMSFGDCHYLMKTAIRHGLDVNWLLSGDLPEDLKKTYSELRKHGFLK